MVFVFFKNKMGRGTQHRIDRGKLFCHELCNCTHGFRLYHNGKIIAAGHQVYRSHLAVLIDSLGNLVKAHLALRRYLYFDQCNDSTMEIHEEVRIWIQIRTIDGEIHSISELLAKAPVLKDFKAVQAGNVWCTTKNLYQESMSVGAMLEDIHAIFSGSQEDGTYLYKLQS